MENVQGIVMALVLLFFGVAIVGFVWGWFAAVIVLRRKVRIGLAEVRLLEGRKDTLERRNLELSGRITAQLDLWRANSLVVAEIE